MFLRVQFASYLPMAGSLPRMLVRAAIVMGLCMASGLWGQENAATPSVLHIQHSVTTSNPHFPQYVFTYHVLDGGNSPAEALSLAGNISIANQSANFSEVLWVLIYWNGECPADKNLTNAQVLWTDILKNPSQSNSTFPVNLQFPHRLPMSGCVGLLFAGGPLVQGAGAVTMSADLDLTYQAATSEPNAILDLSGEYCFGQNWGCQNAATDDRKGFAVPHTMLEAGHLVELFGNISDSTFDGTDNFGPLPTGKSWGAVNDFYLLPGGCGQFEENLNGMGFPKPQLLTTLYSWLPANAVHLDSVPMEYKIPDGETGEATLQKRVERIFSTPVAVNAGDCVVVIYGRSGNGATDNETQVHAVWAP